MDTTKPKLECELDQPIWAVITHDKVIVSNVTYGMAQHHLKALGDEFGKEAVIVANKTAFKMLENEVR